VSFTAAQLVDWLHAFFWPFLRVAAMITAAPVLGSESISPRARLMVAIMITLLLVPVLPPPQTPALFSAAWGLAVVQQIFIGLVIGFTLQLAFEAIIVGGQIVAMGAGLGFAQLTDPVRGVTTPVVSQYFIILASLLFLALQGHLLLIRYTADSFQWLPIGPTGLEWGAAWAVAGFASNMFAGAIQVALPATLAVLLVNIAFGVISRSAPALNLFSIGLPAELLFGLAVLPLTLDGFAGGFNQLLEQAWQLIGNLLRG
jgi:flagellar biosynthetic protein FliR